MKASLAPSKRITVEIRDAAGTVVIGSSTWNSAPLLSRRLCEAPEDYFPSLFTPPTQQLAALGLDTPSYTRPSSPAPFSSPRPKLRVLELGSGTGLVGIVAAALLARILATSSSAHDVELYLTDFQPDVVANLQHNVDHNRALYDLPANCASTLSVGVAILDWRDLEASTIKGQFDVILGSDLVYEEIHAEWMADAVSHFLSPQHSTTSSNQSSTKLSSPPTPLPSRSSSPSPYLRSALQHSTTLNKPAFHLILPLRPTFAVESRAVHRAFGDFASSFEEIARSPLLLPTHRSSDSLRRLGDEEEEETRGMRRKLQIVACESMTGVAHGQGCGAYEYLKITWD